MSRKQDICLAVLIASTAFTGSAGAQTLANTLEWEFDASAYGPFRQGGVTLANVDDDPELEILVGTSKLLGSGPSFPEVRPAALLCIDADGTLKWAQLFPAMATADPDTGTTYMTTSVTSSASVGDIDGDGQVEVLIGVGADSSKEGGLNIVGQPGDRGGVYAVSGDTGAIEWFFESDDIIGGGSNIGDGRPDGVYATPVLADIDEDGFLEVIFGGWDQNVYVLKGESGSVEAGFPQPVLDTIWATPALSDLNSDGQLDILISADISENPDALTQTGGIFHVFNLYGEQNIPGFDEFIGNPDYETLKGKFEPHVLWSSPSAADMDNDNLPEIIYGSGNFPDSVGSGEFIRVWNHDGSSKFLLATNGNTFASPLFADIEGDGSTEMIAATLSGILHVWNNDGSERAAIGVDSVPPGGSLQPIFTAPLAVDIDADGRLEVAVVSGAQVMFYDDDLSLITHNGTNSPDFVTDQSPMIPAIADVDQDGQLDLVATRSFRTSTEDTFTVRRWSIGPKGNASGNYRFARRMFMEPTATPEPVDGIIFVDSFEAP